MNSRVHGRLLSRVLWLVSYRRKMRRDVQFACLTCVHPGDYMTIFDEHGYPHYAEVLQVDQRGIAKLLNDDGCVVERAVG